MIPVQRLNHAVLFVSDLERSLRFYQELFGFELVAKQPPMAFLRAQGSSNHHDLGLLGLGKNASPAPHGSTGLYHLAWQLGTIEELAEARVALREAGAYTGESDHGATKSIYGADPDGNEFELMVLIPRERWGAFEKSAIGGRLNWERELKENA